MKRAILVTGATGFLGSHLVPELVKNDFKVLCLLRPRKGKPTIDRLRESLKIACNEPGEVDDVASQIDIIEGDIGLENFGLNEKEHSALRDAAEYIFHCAAQTSFSSDVETEQWKINVEGTEKLVRFACMGKLFKGFHYISTAYVAGDRDGIVREDELDEGQGFYNGYEKSKCAAEKMLRGYCQKNGLNLTVYRPSIIVGDSNSGRTTLFNGVFLLLRFLHTAKKSFQNSQKQGKVVIPIRGVANPEATKNYVHIDYVIKMIMTILMRPESHGKTYHITHDNPPPIGLIKEVIEDLLGITGMQYFDEKTFQQIQPNELESLLNEQIKTYTPYLLREPSFDKSTIKTALSHNEIPQCPPMDRKALEKLFSYAIKSQWGKRKNV
jgi:thioester reductase-like protein